MNKKMKIYIIVILIVAVIVTVAFGIWYYKTKFYVPDKYGMIVNRTETKHVCHDKDGTVIKPS